MPKFEASVQYDDWTGTAAADDADGTKFRSLLLDRGLISADDFVIGLSLFSGENHGNVGIPSIQAYVVSATNYDQARNNILTSDPVKVREIEVELSVVEFFSLFKRLHLVLGWKNLDLPGRDYEIQESPTT